MVRRYLGSTTVTGLLLRTTPAGIPHPDPTPRLRVYHHAIPRAGWLDRLPTTAYGSTAFGTATTRLPRARICDAAPFLPTVPCVLPHLVHRLPVGVRSNSRLILPVLPLRLIPLPPTVLPVPFTPRLPFGYGYAYVCALRTHAILRYLIGGFAHPGWITFPDYWIHGSRLPFPYIPVVPVGYLPFWYTVERPGLHTRTHA